MIRLLEENEPKKLKRYDTVKYAGYEWYIVNDPAAGPAILLAKDYDFGSSDFDDDSDDYKTSKIRKYLESNVLPRLVRRGAKPMPVRMADAGVTDQVWLLSAEEARDFVSKDIRSFPGYCWWLRSPGYDSRSYEPRAAFVSSAGEICDYGAVVDDSPNYAVRPAIQVNLKDLQQALGN